MKIFFAFLGAMSLVASTAAASDYLVLSPTPAVVQTQRVLTYYGGPTAVVAPTTTYYAPSAATSYYTYAPTATTSYYAPTPVVGGPVPVTSYYAPSYAVQPRVTYYAPTVATPVVSYYAGSAIAAPTYGTPTPVVYGATPVMYGSPAVIRSKVYYPGEPVRNFFRAITP